VEIGDGWVNSEAAPSGHYNYITFKVTNVGSETHMFVVAETGFEPSNLPVENGQVRSYTYVNEPELRFWFGGGQSEGQYGFKAGEVPPGVTPPTPDPVEGVLIVPGEAELVSKVGSYMEPWKSGTVLVLFCNCPGHYERGEYTAITIPQ
jgi:uncharacterized cupredoxin-like copper-binding protein